MVKKMAIKTATSKDKNIQLFSISDNSKIYIVRSIAVLFLLFGVIFVSSKLHFLPEIMPVKKIIINSELNQVNEKQIANIVMKHRNGMLAIDLKELQKDVIKTPWVKSVNIRKIWPDTLSFDIEEYQAIAKVNKYYLTQVGSLIKSYNKINDDLLIHINIEDMDNRNADSLLSLVDKLQVIKNELQKQQLMIEHLTIAKNDNWSLAIENGFLIKIGRKKQFERINQFVQVYSSIENNNRLESIDLRYSNGLAVKIKEQSFFVNKKG